MTIIFVAIVLFIVNASALQHADLRGRHGRQRRGRRTGPAAGLPSGACRRRRRTRTGGGGSSSASGSWPSWSPRARSSPPRGGRTTSRTPTSSSAPSPRPPPRPRPRREAKADPYASFVWPSTATRRTAGATCPAPSSLRPPFRRGWSVNAPQAARVPARPGRQGALRPQRRAVVCRRQEPRAVLWRASSARWRPPRRPTAAGPLRRLLERARAARAGSWRSARRTARSSGRASAAQPRRVLAAARRRPLYFGTENGTVYAMRAANGSTHWRAKAAGAVKGGLALGGGKLFFGDYGGQVYALAAPTASSSGRSARAGPISASLRGASTRRPPSPSGVSTSATPTATSTRSRRHRQARLAHATGGYVYSSAAVAQVPRLAPTVFVGSYDGTFYALDAQSGQRALEQARGRRDLRRLDPRRRHRLQREHPHEADDGLRGADRPRRLDLPRRRPTTPSSPTGRRSSSTATSASTRCGRGRRGRPGADRAALRLRAARARSPGGRAVPAGAAGRRGPGEAPGPGAASDAPAAEAAGRPGTSSGERRRWAAPLALLAILAGAPRAARGRARPRPAVRLQPRRGAALHRPRGGDVRPRARPALLPEPVGLHVPRPPRAAAPLHRGLAAGLQPRPRRRLRARPHGGVPDRPVARRRPLPRRRRRRSTTSGAGCGTPPPGSPPRRCWPSPSCPWRTPAWPSPTSARSRPSRWRRGPPCAAPRTTGAAGRSLAGVAVGVAVGFKYTAGLLVVPVAVAVLLRGDAARRGAAPPRPGRRRRGPGLPRHDAVLPPRPALALYELRSSPGPPTSRSSGRPSTARCASTSTA